MARRRRRWVVRSVLVAACVALTAACAAAQEVGGDGVSAPSEVTAAATPAPERGVASPPAGDGSIDADADAAADDDRPVERRLRPVVDQAVQDLAERLGVPPDRVDVVLAQSVTWPDDRLGCPLRGGREGLGGPRRGTRVHLRVDDLLYRYHTGERREGPFLCDPQAAKSEEYNDRIEP